MEHPLTHERLKELFWYNPETGLFTRRIATSTRTYVGEIAGSPDRDGYIRICINYKLYGAHRLAWFYMTGSWPTKQIDHENRITSDNRFKNLRDFSNKQNSQNKGPMKPRSVPRAGAKTNYVGVSKKNSKWRAQATINGVRIYLGVFETEELANAARQEALATSAKP